MAQHQELSDQEICALGHRIPCGVVGSVHGRDQLLEVRRGGAAARAREPHRPGCGGAGQRCPVRAAGGEAGVCRTGLCQRTSHRENPLGWFDVGKSGPKDECLAYIKEVWTDMRPLSLRKKMEEMERERQAQQQAGGESSTN